MTLRRYLKLLTLGTLLLGPMSLLAATPTNPAPAAALLRTALLVGDVERSLAFYQLLGFEVESDTQNARNPVTTPFPLNAPSTAVRLVILASRSGRGGKLGLVAFSAPVPPAIRPESAFVGRGDPVLVFDVPDAVALHGRLVAAGAKVVESPLVYKSRQTDANGRQMEGRVFHAFDPDGVLIELLEAPKPVSTP